MLLFFNFRAWHYLRILLSLTMICLTQIQLANQQLQLLIIIHSTMIYAQLNVIKTEEELFIIEYFKFYLLVLF